MTPTQEAAMRQALEALETRGEHHPRVYTAITALRAALAEPVQEPVAWIHTDPDNPRVRFLEWREDEPGYRGRWIKTPLFTAPLGFFNCASLQAQNTELDRKLAEMDTALRAQL